MVYNGTIYESHDFVTEQALADVEAAISDGVQMKVLDILTHINNAQRQQLKAAFKAKTGKELEDEVKRVLKERETEDGIEACVPWNDVFAIAVSLLNTPAQEDASWLHKSIDRIGTNEKVLVEILCSRTNVEIAAIRAEYEKQFQSKLEDDIAKDTSGTLKAILTALSTGNRDESVDTDHLHAAEDADKLYKAGEAKLGTDEKVFVDILTTKSWPQLGLIFSEYERLFGHSFEVAIEKEFSRYSKDALQTIFDVHNNKALYFATRIHNACKGPGTRDHDLIRILVGRSEIDLALIRAKFERLYNKSLYETLKDECSGVYLEAFLALVKGNQVQDGQIQ